MVEEVYLSVWLQGGGRGKGRDKGMIQGKGRGFFSSPTEAREVDGGVETEEREVRMDGDLSVRDASPRRLGNFPFGFGSQPPNPPSHPSS